MPSISQQMAKPHPFVKGTPRPSHNYRAARRNAVRAAIRKAAEAKRSFPGWGD